MGAIRDLSDSLWSGATSTAEQHPFTVFLGLEEYGPGLAFVSSFANSVALETPEGLVVVDTGSPFTGDSIRDAVRSWSAAPVRTVVFTHGHVDHVMGVRAFEGEERPAGARFEVLAHRAITERFERYTRSAGYNGHVNARQFRQPGLGWPTEYRAPDRVYDDTLALDLGGVRIELRHARGETDDHTWLWIPSHRAVCTGDLFIWAAPNCGNPQKAQRYPLEQARALDAMRALEPALLFPGHGPAIEGRARVATALEETAALLRFLHDETLAKMNAGCALDQILDEVRAPASLLARPYLRPVYDEPEFIVRNVWRLYGGWWDGNAARLKPPRDEALAREVAALAGGAAVLAERAQSLAGEGSLALACQLIEWAARALPDDAAIAAARGRIYAQRARSETSLMAASIYLDAASSPPR